MNLFSRLSEILACDCKEGWQEEKDLDRVFARNERQMDEDLGMVKRYAVAVIAIERSLARQLKQHRARAARWERKAGEFLSLGNERLADQALVRVGWYGGFSWCRPEPGWLRVLPRPGLFPAQGVPDPNNLERVKGIQN